MKPAINPLLKPLKNLMKVAAMFQTIPAFQSESLANAMNECRAAVKAEAEKGITKTKNKTK